MKIQFESDQDYQLDAVEAVKNIFDGQPLDVTGMRQEINSDVPTLLSESTLGNNLLIDEIQIAENVRSIQLRNGIEDPKYHIESEAKERLHLQALEDGNNFTVEMETGTGKTYVYLRTIHELYNTFGFKKFIIVVPSIAVKEGVIKNLQITREHFDLLYGRPSMDWYVWDPKKRGQAKQFATNNNLQIMVINIDSFAKNDNIINQQSDWGVPAEYIRATNPIVIVDEPQNMETEKRREAIGSLNPLCTLRYSATHKYPYNMVYKLDPVKAYDLGLVKKIEVDSVFSEDAFNSAYIFVQKIENKGKNGLVAKLELDSDDSRGLQRKVITVQSGSSLFDITKRSVYDGYVVDEIDAIDNTITFTNGKVFYLGQKDESLHEQIIKYQLRRTIENHLDKELRLQSRGVKVLSLFFIDKVSNYREYTDTGQQKGKFAIWFEEAYEQLRILNKYASLNLLSPESVHNGYFSADKGGSWRDTRGDTKVDDQTYELIMRDKERLLNPAEPLRFIFSHSALREGWDNPNVFQICTLNETASEMKKRQEIGRGLRLPVDAYGIRVRDESVNILTVIANESYDDFAKALQGEIEDETGVLFGSGRIKKSRDRRMVQVKKGFEFDENFIELWARIKHKTRYRVEFDSSELIQKATLQMKEVVINAPRITSRRALLDIQEAGVTGTVRSDRSIDVHDSPAIPDILEALQSRTKLTRKTIYDIIEQSNSFADILKNPQQFIDELVRVINQVMPSLMVDGIKYEKVDDEWDMLKFDDDELLAYIENLVQVNDLKKTLYDHIAVDSDIEREFAADLEASEDVKFYFKLPGWFRIDTPLGTYNPDWAVILERDNRIYFVAETKGVNSIDDIHLSLSERLKIVCGRKHFTEIGVEFHGPVKEFQQIIF